MTSDPLQTQAKNLPVDTGIDRDARKQLAASLNEFLAGTYVLYQKTQYFHWNVTGPLFYSVHKLTDDQYHELAEAIDDTAERIRAIGFPAEGGIRNYLERSIVEDSSKIPTAREMVSELARDHQTLATQGRKIVNQAEELNDVYTQDFVTGRVGEHEEQAWMLNALLVDSAEN